MHHESPRSTALLVVLVVLVMGCRRRPEAPLLSDSPVYHNTSEGFRFLVPEGWTQTASSSLPPGHLEDEVFLVRYRFKLPEMGATLQVLCMEDDESTDLQEHHAGPSFRVARWDVVQPRETLSIGGQRAERIIYKARIDEHETTKHVTCFRHKGRVYSFVGLYFSSADEVRQQIERATASVIWDD